MPEREEDPEKDDSFLRAIASAPSKSPPSDHDPERIAHFRIESRLGRGGMGIVYRAEDEKLARTVAIKVLPREFAGDEERRRRFLREARSAAGLTHPNIATVYDVGEDEGRIYIVMELVEGEPLRDVIARGPLPVDRAVSIARDIARGLARAHEKGIVHRDLKPENVIVSKSGEAKLLDFGLAKMHALEMAAESHHTEEGQLLGSPRYMSPEQILAQPIDARSDVFSFGVVLYEMCAGTRPFDGKTTAQVLVAVSRDDPAPLDGIPRPLVRVVARCLEKTPEKRYANGQELALALESLGTSKTLPFAPLAIAGVATLAIWSALHFRHARPEASATPTPDAHVSRAMTEWPPPKTSSTEAASLYAAALQSWRDANLTTGMRDMTRATQLDPHFSAAQVRRVLMSGSSIEEMRSAVTAAMQSRAQLDARDARFLELAQLIVRDTKGDDLKNNARALATEMPDDSEALFWAAQVLEGSYELDEARTLAATALELDPKFAAAEHMRARVARNVGDLDGALAAAQRCLAISPGAASCQRRVANVHAARGECTKLEEDARRIITLEPTGDLGYGFLVAALAAQGAPADALDQLAKKAASVATDPRDARRLTLAYKEFIAVYQGDFDTAEGALVGLDQELADAVDEDEHPWPAVLMMLYEEEGEDAKALALADDYMRRRRAWSHHSPAFARDYALASQHRKGAIDDAAFRSTRDAWIAEDKKGLSGAFDWLWVVHYGLPPRTTTEAREAMAAFPQFQDRPPAPGLFSDQDAIYGRTRYLSGDAAGALSYLRSATTGCGHTPEHLFDLNLATKAVTQIRSFLFFGLALEQTGDKAGACKAFERLLDRWGKAKPRSTSADEARKHLKNCQ